MTRRTQIGLKLAGFSFAFLSLTIVCAFLIRGALVPVSGSQDRSPASVQSLNMFEHRGDLSASELGMLGSTPLKRGRNAVFHVAEFRRRAGLRAGTVADNSPGSVKARATSIVLNLFPDISLTADIHEESTYMVNDGLYVGTISGDPDSTVRIMIQNGAVDGTINYRGTEFRILDGGGNDAVVITEARK